MLISAITVFPLACAPARVASCPLTMLRVSLAFRVVSAWVVPLTKAASYFDLSSMSVYVASGHRRDGVNP
jgi:hypothetical protein